MINPVFLMKSIIECEATFEKNSDIEVTVIQKKSSQAFVKDTNEAEQSTRRDKPSTGDESLLIVCVIVLEIPT